MSVDDLTNWPTVNMLKSPS